MRKVIGFIIFLIIIFVVNLFFYFLSEDYRFFLKKIKDTDEVIYLEEKEVSDELEREIIQWAQVVKTSTKNENIFELKEDTWRMDMRDEISFWVNYNKIIDLFALYDLKKLEINSNLFDLTNEYPDNYFEYYSKELVLYLFPTKNYTEIYDIFSVLDDELPFTINELNNFWDKSFYINLNEDIKDRFVRLIISNNWVTFGLKIKNAEYNLVKEKLNLLKKDDSLIDNENLLINDQNTLINEENLLIDEKN